MSDLTAYTEYLTYYFKEEDSSVPNKAYINHELAIKRKLCSIRSLYAFLFKNQRISSNVTELVPLPKIHEKPIIRLSKNELVRILDTAQSGDQMSAGQKRFQKLTAKRDFALLSLFLGTGIRVSECVGININDIDFENNAFVVTRKGGNQVVLYFSPEVADALADYLTERKDSCCPRQGGFQPEARSRQVPGPSPPERRCPRSQGGTPPGPRGPDLRPKAAPGEGV